MAPQDQNKNITTPSETPPPMTSSQPGGFTSPTTPPTMSANLGRSKKKKLLIAGLILLVIILLVGGGWFYYSRPQRVLADALSKTTGAETATFNGQTTASLKSGATPFDVSVDFSGERAKDAVKLDAKSRISAGAGDLNVDMSFLARSNETYFKINNAKQLSEFAASIVGESTLKPYEAAIQKADNKWVSLENQGDANSTSNRCTSALTGFQLSTDDQKTLKNLFNQHPFMKANGGGSGSFLQHHYNLSLDENQGRKFLQETVKLNSFKQLSNSCGLQIDADDVNKTVDQAASNQHQADVKAELWVHKLTHKPTKMALTIEDAEAKLTFTSNLELGKSTNISKPEGATPLNEILKELQAPAPPATENKKQAPAQQ